MSQFDSLAGRIKRLADEFASVASDAGSRVLMSAAGLLNVFADFALKVAEDDFTDDDLARAVDAFKSFTRFIDDRGGSLSLSKAFEEVYAGQVKAFNDLSKQYAERIRRASSPSEVIDLIEEWLESTHRSVPEIYNYLWSDGLLDEWLSRVEAVLEQPDYAERVADLMPLLTTGDLSDAYRYPEFFEYADWLWRWLRDFTSVSGLFWDYFYSKHSSLALDYIRDIDDFIGFDVSWM